jgi:hypothetical protein
MVHLVEAPFPDLDRLDLVKFDVEKFEVRVITGVKLAGETPASRVSRVGTGNIGGSRRSAGGHGIDQPRGGHRASRLQSFVFASFLAEYRVPLFSAMLYCGISNGRCLRRGWFDTNSGGENVGQFVFGGKHG